MTTDLPVITTSLIDRAVQLAKDAVLLDCIGTITGPNGSGKSVALKTILSRYPSLGLDGNALYHRACATQGHTRGVKDILAEFGVREAHVSSSNLQIACKLGLREFSGRKVRLLLLDEADSMARDSVAGITTLIDYCNGHGHRIGLVMAAAQPISGWFASNSAGMSRTVRMEKTDNMSVEEMLAILREWIPGLTTLIAQASEKNPEALKLARLVHKGVGDGNFRRMGYFASLLRLEETVNEETIKRVLTRIALIPSKP
jgi:hypothetical protein